MQDNQMQSVDTDETTWHLTEGAIGRLARGRVKDMSFSADGKYLAVATLIGCWLYDRSSLKPIALFDTESGMLSAVIFSHDTQLIATSNFDGVVKIWNTQNLQCIAKIDHRKNVEATTGGFLNLHFSQDNQLKCYRLFRPKFSKVKTSFFAQIPQVSNTLTQSEGVCDYILV